MTAILQRFTKIRREEVALMVMRPARDALGMQRGIDAIRWLSIGMADNMGAAMGRLPNAATRRRMIQLVEALPSA